MWRYSMQRCAYCDDDVTTTFRKHTRVRAPGLVGLVSRDWNLRAMGERGEIQILVAILTMLFLNREEASSEKNVTR